jgi:hypothetical protein
MLEIPSLQRVSAGPEIGSVAAWFVNSLSVAPEYLCVYARMDLAGYRMNPSIVLRRGLFCRDFRRKRSMDTWLAWNEALSKGVIFAIH